MPFDLPRNFQPNIQAGLDEKNLTGRARAKFITSIAEAIYRFKSYPTREEYEHVANQIVKKWTFLETKTGHVSNTTCKDLKILCTNTLWSVLSFNIYCYRGT